MPRTRRSYEALARIMDILADEDASKLVVVHHNGDPDAVGSAVALATVFPSTRIGAPLGLSNTGKRLLAASGMEALERPPYDTFDYVVLVDTSSKVQLGEHATHIREPILIDHHAYGDDWDDALYVYIDPSKASCCEVIHDILHAAYDEGLTPFHLGPACPDVEALERVGVALLTGIWTDSGGFRHAHPSTLTTAANLLTATGTSLTDVLSILEDEPEFHDGKRQAHLKAAQRLQFRTIGPLTVATSHVSAYEASAARALTLIGADVALVVADTKAEIRCSGRARKRAVQDHGVHLGELMNTIGREIGMMGGGHDGAAGMNLPKQDARQADAKIPTGDELLAALMAGLSARHPS